MKAPVRLDLARAKGAPERMRPAAMTTAAAFCTFGSVRAFAEDHWTARATGVTRSTAAVAALGVALLALAVPPFPAFLPASAAAAAPCCFCCCCFCARKERFRAARSACGLAM